MITISWQKTGNATLSAFDPKQFKNGHVRHSVGLALAYRREIEALVSQQPESRRQKLSTTLVDIERWVEQIYLLAQAIDAAESQEIISRDKVRLPREIEQFKAQESKERNPQKKLKLTEAIKAREQLLENLRGIEASVQETHNRLDKTLSDLKNVLEMIKRLPRTQKHSLTNILSRFVRKLSKMIARFRL